MSSATLFDCDSPAAAGTLAEQYRPRQWSDVVGQDKVLAIIETLRKRGLSGRAYWLSGESGTGKTTIARLIAAEVAEEHAIEEVDANGLTPARVAELARQSACRAIGAKSGRAYLVNEAHGLRRDTMRQLLVAIEELPRHVVWIFTTTTDGQKMLFEGAEDTAPLLSRCSELALARRDLSVPFAQRCQAIAQREGLDGGRSVDDYRKLLQACKNNLRAALQKIEGGAML